MKFTSDTHRAVCTEDGLLRVWRIIERVVTETTYEKGKPLDPSSDRLHTLSSTSDPLVKDLLEGLERTPTFAATYAGGEEFNIDAEAGFQRWQGMKTKKEVKAALKVCGFDTTQAQKLVTKAKKTVHKYCPRQG